MKNNISNEEKLEQSIQRQEIDWMKLIRKIRTSRKLILIFCCVGVVLGIIIAFGTPQEYTASTLLAHEGTRRRSNMNILADVVGSDMNSSTTTMDAIYPSLYSMIVKSTPFLVRLFDVGVSERKDSTTITLSQYLKERQKKPWWNTIISMPSRLMSWITSSFRKKLKVENAKSSIDIFQLTREEASIAGAIASRITIDIDKKKRTISLFVTMQDPLVAAIVTDTVRAYIQEYVTEYRTSKERRILEYYKKMCKDAQTEYYTTQEKYTRYADSNRNLAMLTSRAELSRLRSEMSLAFSTYNQLELQVQAAQARVEKVTPVYAVIQPAIVPIAPSKPRKMLILVGCILLSTIASIAWVLYIKDFIHLLIHVKNKNIR